MTRRPLSFLYGATPARFESSFSLEESIRRLEAATKRTAFSALTSEQAVGRVRASRVMLQRSIPYVQNSFKPFFVGRFERTHEGIVLRGHFTMHWVVKVFLSFWFGFCLFWIGMATHSVVTSEQAEYWWFPLAGLGMFGAGLALVQVGKYFARNDIAWLTSVISSALSTEVRPNSSFKPTPRRGAA